jgi:hypothetical protein
MRVPYMHVNIYIYFTVKRFIGSEFELHSLIGGLGDIGWCAVLGLSIRASRWHRLLFLLGYLV